MTRREQLGVKKAKKEETAEKIKAKGRSKGENAGAGKGKGKGNGKKTGKNEKPCKPTGKSGHGGKDGENQAASDADGSGEKSQSSSTTRKKGKVAKTSEDVDMEAVPIASRKRAVKSKAQAETHEAAPKPKAARRKSQESTEQVEGDAMSHDKTEKTEKVSQKPKAEKEHQADVEKHRPEPKTWARRSRPKSSAGALKWDTLKAIFIQDVKPCLRSNVSVHEELSKFQSCLTSCEGFNVGLERSSSQEL